MAESVDVPARPAMSVPTPSRTGEAPKRRRDVQRQEVDQARLKALKADEWLKAKADERRDAQRQEVDQAA